MPPCSVSVFANKGTNAAPQPRCCFPTGLLSPCPAPHQQGHGEVRVGPSPGRDPRPCSRGQMPVVGAGGVQLLTPTPSLQQGSSAQGALLLPQPSGCRRGAALPLQPPAAPWGGSEQREQHRPLLKPAAGHPAPHTPPHSCGVRHSSKKKRLKKSRGLMLHDADGMRHLPPAPTAVPMAPAPALGTPRGASEGLGGAQPRGADVPLSLQVRTADMGGYATSLDFTQAVIAALDV